MDRACRDFPRPGRPTRRLRGYAARRLVSPSGSLKITRGGTPDEIETAATTGSRQAARKASADTARRVADARERHFAGSYGGGPRPYGYVHAQDTEKYHRT